MHRAEAADFAYFDFEHRARCRPGVNLEIRDGREHAHARLLAAAGSLTKRSGISLGDTFDERGFRDSAVRDSKMVGGKTGRGAGANFIGVRERFDEAHGSAVREEFFSRDIHGGGAFQNG